MEKTETLKAWAAGIMDGEGSIGIKKTGASGLQMLLAATNSDGRIIDVIYDIWGGYVHTKTAEYLASHRKSPGKNVKAGYWIYFSDYYESKIFLEDIIPYLRSKKAEAEIILRALIAVGPRPDGQHRRSPGVSNILRPFYEELTAVSEQQHSPECPIRSKCG